MVQQNNTASSEEWSCEKVAKRVATIKGVPDYAVPALVRNYVNGSALLVMGREDLKEIGVTKVGPLALLVKEISNLCRKNKFEAVLIDHNAYCFGKIQTHYGYKQCARTKILSLLYTSRSHIESTST